jgi:hypothetical protein
MEWTILPQSVLAADQEMLVISLPQKTGQKLARGQLVIGVTAITSM